MSRCVPTVKDGTAEETKSGRPRVRFSKCEYFSVAKLRVLMIQEASAVLFLSLGGWETITVGIFSFYIAGSANEAAALGVILIAVAALTVLVINRLAGTRLGGMFG